MKGAGRSATVRHLDLCEESRRLVEGAASDALVPAGGGALVSAAGFGVVGADGVDD